MITQLKKLVSIVEQSLFKEMFTGRKPRSIASHAMVKQLVRLAPGLEFIIDGGANHGQFSRACADYFPNANIIAFEPSASTAKICQSNLHDLTQLQLVQKALGRENGQLEFFESSNSQNSSLLESIPGNVLLGDAKVIEKNTVEVIRLDTFLEGKVVPAKSLLKLDLQGFEKPALEGAGARLRDFKFVLLECPLMKAYAGEASFGELTVMLTQAGYELEGLLNVASRSGTIVQVDALFVRVESTHA
jgi:FkbM family methyltransferase